jgi:type IV pilus assembly protein PilC
MPTFIWEGKTLQGVLKKGEMEADDKAAVMATLRAQQVFPSKIKEKGKGILDMEINIPGLGGKVKEKEIAVFTRQFATMIDAGLPLVQCLDILASQQVNKTFKKVLLKVKEDVEGGSTFADALSKHPKVFDQLYTSLVAAGEVGGILDTILNRLSLYIEKAIRLKAKVKGAMVYPSVIITVAVGVLAIILVFVIPTFSKMFAEVGQALPAPTQLVINLSNFVTNNILYGIIGIIILIIGFRVVYRAEKGRAIFDNLVLKIPVIGDLIKKVSVARFSRTLGTLVSSGVPILDGLDIVAKISGNKTVESALKKTKESVSEGKTLAEPLKETKVFPPMVVQMIGVGEATGAMDTMLSKIADFYDEEVDTAVDALTSLLEPLLMVFLGVTIGGLVIAMYLPIFKIAGAITG